MAITINGTVANYRNTEDLTAQSTTLNSVATGEGVVVIVMLAHATISVSSVDVGSATGIAQIGATFNPSNVGADRWRVYFYPNSTQSGNLTVTVNLSGAENPRIIAFRVGGHDTGTYSGATNSGTGNGTDPSINLTVSANSAIFGCLSLVDPTYGVGTNYTMLVDLVSGMEWYAATEYDLDAGAAGTKAVDFDENDFGEWGIFAFELKVGNTAPTITDASDEIFYNGETGITITGTNFGSSQGNGTVKICPSDNVNDASAVTQTVTSWTGGSSITITASRGSLSYGTNLYLFVTTDGGLTNAAGYVVQFGGNALSYPDLVNYVRTVTDSGTSHSISLPTSAAGDLLLLLVGCGNTVIVSGVTSAGYTALYDEEVTGLAGKHMLLAKKSVGPSEPGTLVLTTDTNTKMSVIAARIMEWNGSDTSNFVNSIDFEVEADINSRTTFDPPALTAAWGYDKNLFLAAFSNVGTQVNPMAFNDGAYTLVDLYTEQSVSSGSSIGLAWAQLQASSANPGTFTGDTIRDGVAYTIAIRPVGEQAPAALYLMGQAVF